MSKGVSRILWDKQMSHDIGQCHPIFSVLRIWCNKDSLKNRLLACLMKFIWHVTPDMLYGLSSYSANAAIFVLILFSFMLLIITSPMLGYFYYPDWCKTHVNIINLYFSTLYFFYFLFIITIISLHYYLQVKSWKFIIILYLIQLCHLSQYKVNNCQW